MTGRLPSIFLGHGNPMNALRTDPYTEAWERLGQSIPRPRAILSISAHWFVPGIAVTASAQPRTIHDFVGFPEELYHVNYPAPGDSRLAQKLQQLLAPLPVRLDENRGLDHGTWSVLRHVYPSADIPVVQMSMDDTKPASFHFDLGKKLAPLREEGVLILGSGNLVHNLEAIAWGVEVSQPYAWAVRFEREARLLLAAGDCQALVEYQRLGSDALLAIPTLEHFLPLLYVIGSKLGNEAITFPVQGIDRGAISMLAVQVG